MRGLKWALASLLLAGMATAVEAQGVYIRWSGPGWYVDQSAIVTVALLAGPFANQPACDATRTQLIAQGNQNLGCEYIDHDPDADNMMNPK
jgi:hypothetical protein